MDITPGAFKDFSRQSSASIGDGYTPRSGSSHASRSGSAFSCSFELLAPEPLPMKTNGQHTDRSRSATDDDSDDSLSSCEIQDPTSLVPKVETKRSSGQDFARPEHSCDPDDTALRDQMKMAKAIRKMKKLDKILAQKRRREKEVKHQRLLGEKLLHSEIAEFKQEGDAEPHCDVTHNTSKYLALLPPIQQLDVLIERNEDALGDIDPIFKTQTNDEQLLFHHSNQNHTRNAATQDEHKQTRATSASAASERPASAAEETATKPSSAGTSKKRASNREAKTDFIKRNIELVKEAGEYISMTPEEKERLSDLLKDLDEDVDDNEADNDRGPISVLDPCGTGFCPDRDDMDRLDEIEQRLHDLSWDTSSALSGRTSGSTGLPRPPPSFTTSHVTPSSWMSGQQQHHHQVARSELTEALNPTQRLEEVDQKLSRLDYEWKQKYDRAPRLDDATLRRLLDDSATPSTGRTSFATDFASESRVSSRDSIAGGDFAADDDVIADAATSSTTCLSRDDDDVTTVASMSSTRLSRETIDSLLHEARACLGLLAPDEDDEFVTSPNDDYVTLHKAVDADDDAASDCEGVTRSNSVLT